MMTLLMLVVGWVVSMVAALQGDWLVCAAGVLLMAAAAVRICRS